MPVASAEYCLFWINHWSTCMPKSEWSGWAQAVVSTLAVALAAGGIWWQVRAQAKLHRDQIVRDEIRLLKIVGQFVFEVRAKLRLISDDELPHLHGNWTSIDGPICSIKAIAFERYPVEGAAFAVASALLSYDFMRHAYSKIGDGIGTPGEIRHIEDSREHTLASFFRAECEIDVALVERGSGLTRMRIGFGDGVFVETMRSDPVLG